MEKLNYIIEDKTIVELLGIQNFTSDESAILELIKNAYDAKATEVKLIFSNNQLIIMDNGEGMNYDDIRNHWMHVGKSNKGYEILDENNKKRIQTGCKGIGRFALARLGEYIEIQTKKEQFEGVIWTTDWNDSNLKFDNNILVKGTVILINGLRKKWKKTRINNLLRYIETTYNDDVMLVKVICEEYDINKSVSKIFPPVKAGLNCKTSINLDYDNGKLNINIISDEFDKAAENYCKDINIREKQIELNTYDELQENKVLNNFEINQEEKKKLFKDIGKFSATLYFNTTASNYDKEKFLYKYLKTQEILNSGIILYRNAFSISSYEGKKDWLGFGKRSRKSPAAATHETGSWRVRENQLAGFVLIDKLENRNLEDLSNRQGLDENIYYQLFIEIILLGIKEFERYRQCIIRAINHKNKIEEFEDRTITQKILKKEKSVDDLNKEELNELIKEMKQYKNIEIKSKKEKEEVEKKYKYEVRVLNALATSGMKATSIAHEINNERNQMEPSYDDIVEALKKYDVWDVVNDPQNRKIACEDIPGLLENNHNAVKKILRFIDAILEKIEKKQFIPIYCNINNIIHRLINKWERDYNWLNIKIILNEEIFFNIPEDVFYTIFDNLILNSIQQNKEKNKLDIEINIKKVNNKLNIEYCDKGKGLANKYLRDPKIILEPHETSRNDGHGLGMWIVNNTIDLLGGKILDISGENGFKFVFEIWEA